MISKNTTLQNKLKKITKSHLEVLDIIMFGSVVRGKQDPTDVDILVLFKNKVNKEIEYIIRKELEKEYPKVSILSKTEKTVQDEAFDARESILFEGLSLLTGKSIAEKHGFSPWGMVKYNFKEWNNLQKTKLYHALNGRNNSKGILSLLSCIKLSDSLILVPLDKIEEFKEFLEQWKLEYIYIPILIPTRLSKKKIIG